MSAWEAPGKTDEWFTPPYVFDALGVEFDMDVASPIDRSFVSVPARHFITENSLEVLWSGFVWMNPPFGGRSEKKRWLDKFFCHGNGIALTPDRTSAPWFQDAWFKADLIMFTPKIRFIGSDGAPGTSPSNGTALWASGPLAVSALRNAQKKGLGILALPFCEKGARDG